ASQEVTGSIAGLKLGSDAPRIFRALVEATAFGSKAIVDRFAREGVRIDGVIGLGGVARSLPLLCRLLLIFLTCLSRLPAQLKPVLLVLLCLLLLQQEYTAM